MKWATDEGQQAQYLNFLAVAALKPHSYAESNKSNKGNSLYERKYLEGLEDTLYA